MPDRAEPYVLVVGESLVDAVVSADGALVERPGGSAANVAVALARLGRRTRLATAWADDERGAVLATRLAADGVQTAGDPQVLARTSVARAVLDDAGAASYEFDLEWRLPDLDAVLADPPAWVHVCSIGAVLAPGADDVLALLGRLAGTPVLYDVNARPSITGTGPDVVARVEAVAREAHVLKASDEDLAAVYPTLSEAEAVDHLLGLGRLRAVVVTHGSGGLAWADGVERIVVPAAPARVVDTIGAGDTVSAALVDALWRGAGPREALEHAARAAAVTVSRPGADPPTRAELG